MGAFQGVKTLLKRVKVLDPYMIEPVVETFKCHNNIYVVSQSSQLDSKDLYCLANERHRFSEAEIG